MTDKSWPNLVQMFFKQAQANAKRPFLWSKVDGRYTTQTWHEVATKVAKLAEGLRALGIEKGDRVALVSENRPEWLIADMAIMAAGAISVPTYTTNTSRDHAHILENSDAKGAIVSTAKLAKALLPAAHESDYLQFVIAIEPPRVAQSINAEIHSWDDVIAGQPGDIERLAEEAKAVGPEEVACLIYTSGTGGAPKGVMIPHRAVLCNCIGADEVLEELGRANHSFLSFLPLSHAYEHSAGQFLPIFMGAEIYYSEGIDKLGANIEEVRPTIMVVVPRLFEMLRNRVTRTVMKEGGLKARLFVKSMDLATRRLKDPNSLGFLERLQDRALDRLVRAKVRQRFGGRLKALVSGGGPLNPEVGQFFLAFDLPLLQGYGQTEAAPVISVNRPSNAKVHTVGPPLKGVEVKIADDGEILVRGDLVMHGYWDDEHATAKTLIDGWLHTGDIGEIDEDGHLVITDRKKDIIVNDKGENISPQRVEGMLALEPEIAQVMVYGDDKPHLVGLVVPDADWIKDWSRANEKPRDIADLISDPDFRKAIDSAVGRVNSRLSSREKVRRFAIAEEPFTIENEQMTPTLKIRRHAIIASYRSELEALY